MGKKQKYLMPLDLDSRLLWVTKKIFNAIGSGFQITIGNKHI